MEILIAKTIWLIFSVYCIVSIVVVLVIPVKKNLITDEKEIFSNQNLKIEPLSRGKIDYAISLIDKKI